MQLQLAAIIGQFEQVQARLHELVDALPDDRWAKRADPARWSVAECVAHLNLTGQAYIPLLRTALTEGRARKRPAPAKHRLGVVGWLLARATGPLPSVGGFRLGRVPTVAAFVPLGDLPRAEVVAEFDRLQSAQIGLVRDAEGLPLEDLSITSPFNARIRYNVFVVLNMLPGHQLRHVIQAENVWTGQ